MTHDDIAKATDWLVNQRQVVSPGPIDTLREALKIAESVLIAKEKARAQYACCAD